MAGTSISDVLCESDVDEHRIDIVSNYEEGGGCQQGNGGLFDGDDDLEADGDAGDDVDELETCEEGVDDGEETETHDVDIEGSCFEEVGSQVKLETVLPAPAPLLTFLLPLLLLLVKLGPVDLDEVGHLLEDEVEQQDQAKEEADEGEDEDNCAEEVSGCEEVADQIGEVVVGLDVVVEQVVKGYEAADNPDYQKDIVLTSDQFDHAGNASGFFFHIPEVEFLPVEVVVAFLLKFHQALDLFLVADSLGFFNKFFLHFLGELVAEGDLGEV